MERTIYAKFSNERSRELSIVTKIKVSREGKRFLSKEPAFPEAQSHIKNIYKMYEKLTENYKNSEKIAINKCEILDENTIGFEYIEGETLEQVVDKYVFAGEYKKAVNLIGGYIKELEKYNSGTKFEETPEFVKIFGHTESFKDSYSGTVNDIDRLLGNVVLKDGKYIFIDYEWTFDFPVPVEFILYRILHYYLNSDHRRKVLIDEGIYETVNITEKQIEECEKMEVNFQKYVSGNVTSVAKLHDDMVKNVYDMKTMVKLAEKESEKQNVKIYYSDNGEFSEDNSELFHAQKTGAEYILKKAFKSDYKKIRIDITEARSIIKISGLEINGQSVLTDQFLTVNGYKLADDTWAFFDGDPNMVMSKECNEGDVLEIRYEIIYLSDDVYRLVRDGYLTKDHLYNLKVNELAGKQAELDALKESYEMLLQERDRLFDSLSWKITKPIRKMGTLLKRRDS